MHDGHRSVGACGERQRSTAGLVFVAVHSEQPLLALGCQTGKDHLISVSTWRKD